MKSKLTSGLWMTIFTLIPLHTLVAQGFPPLVPQHSCGQCQLPASHCQCRYHVPQTEYVPQTQTRYRQQQEITYKDVKETRYRMEAKTEKVPVTTYETVTVDEGEYKKVWVPKLVTKRVPKTCYQNRITYNRVPYEVTRKVPQVSTKCVPEQVVTWVPRATATAQNHCVNPQTEQKQETARLETQPETKVPTPREEVADSERKVPQPAEAEPQDELAPSPSLLDTPSELLTEEDTPKGNPFLKQEEQVAQQPAPIEKRTPKRTANRSRGKFVPVPKTALWYSRGVSRQ